MEDKDYAKQKVDFLSSVSEVLPFDVESSWKSVFANNDYRQVEGYGAWNPMCQAFYSEQQKKVFVYFHLCPLVEFNTVISFHADSYKETQSSMCELLRLILDEINARLYGTRSSIFEITQKETDKLKRFIVMKGFENIERNEIAQTG